VTEQNRELWALEGKVELKVISDDDMEKLKGLQGRFNLRADSQSPFCPSE
jgi:hypothetical protein